MARHRGIASYSSLPRSQHYGIGILDANQTTSNVLTVMGKRTRRAFLGGRHPGHIYKTTQVVYHSNYTNHKTVRVFDFLYNGVGVQINKCNLRGF